MVVARLRKRPLPASFLLVGLLGFAVSLIYTSGGRLPLTWGVTLLLFSIILTAASLRSLGTTE